MSIHFRKMTEQDVPAVSGLEKRLFSRPWSEQSLLQALCQSTLFVVALERNVVVGYCGMYCAFQEGEIMNVAVDPAWQGQDFAGDPDDRQDAGEKRRLAGTGHWA